METSNEIRIEYVNFEEIMSWPRNPKDHDLHELRKSFERWGFIKPVLVDEGTGLLVAGHGRIDTLKYLKGNGKEAPKGVFIENDEWKVPVLRGVVFEDPSEAEAFLLADNRLSEIGGWKKDLLAEMLEEIVDIDGALDGVGFNIAEIMDLTGETARERSERVEKMREDFHNGIIVAIGFFTMLVTPDMPAFDNLYKLGGDKSRLSQEESTDIVNRISSSLSKE